MLYSIETRGHCGSMFNIVVPMLSFAFTAFLVPPESAINLPSVAEIKERWGIRQSLCPSIRYSAVHRRRHRSYESYQWDKGLLEQRRNDQQPPPATPDP